MRIKLGIFFGGKSVEHEISIITMIQALEGIDEEKYEIVPIYIAKDGVLYTGDDLLDLEQYKDLDVLLKRSYKVTLVNDGKKVNVIRYPAPIIGKKVMNTIDVAFPIVHGTNVEDGTIAGYLNMLNLPYVGPDILASSIGMDKILMKRVLRDAGIPVVDFVAFYSLEYIKDEEKILKEVEKTLGFPVIVKQGNLGSSVGIKKASTMVELEEAIEFAMEFADRVIVEKAVVKLKEINCSVLGNVVDTEASECEDPFFSDEILSYEDKYLGGGKGSKGGMKGRPAKGGKLSGSKVEGRGMAVADKKLPADITKEQKAEIQRLAQETFKVLGCAGVSRVDFLIDEDTGKIYVNEINTIPGALSYYLWEATGKNVVEEMEELINIAIKRGADRDKLTFSYDQNILAMQGNGVKGSKGMKGSKAGNK